MLPAPVRSVDRRASVDGPRVTDLLEHGETARCEPAAANFFLGAKPLILLRFRRAAPENFRLALDKGGGLILRMGCREKTNRPARGKRKEQRDGKDTDKNGGNVAARASWRPGAQLD